MSKFHKIKSFILSTAFGVLAASSTLNADTPPQVINKTCSSNQFLNKIAPGAGNITCAQPSYSGISNTPSFADSLQIATNIVTLVNDAVNPGASKYYGTNSGGTRGFFSLPSSASSIGVLDSASPSANGAVISGSSLVMQSASDTKPGLINISAQSFAGDKTFGGSISAANLSGSNSGDVTLASVGSSPNSAGASVSGQVVTLQPANGSNPGVLSIGAQTIAGAKTFSGAISASNLSGSNTGDVTIGTANGLSLIGQAISLATSSGSTTGALSSTDWNTFNNKQAAGSYVTASSTDTLTNKTIAAGSNTISGLANANLSGSAAISNANLAAMSAHTLKANATAGSATPTDVATGTATEATSSVLTLTGWTNATVGSPTIQVKQAATGQSGYLSSTDWNTFNGKQDAGNYITALTGDVAASGPGSAASTIQAGAITNAKVNGSAAIDFSKLAALTSGNILVGSGLNVATSTAVTGDVTISNAGVTAIGSGKITNAMVNAAAAIAYSKLALSNSILNADVNSAAAISYSKLALTGSILNADLAGSIAYSKLVLTNSVLNADINSAAAIAYSKLALTGSILNADINSAAAIAGSKISPDFGSQNAVTTGSITGARLIVTGSTVPANGIYLPSANTLGFSANTTAYGSVSSAGAWTIGASGSTQTQTLNGNVDVSRNMGVSGANSSFSLMNTGSGGVNNLAATTQVGFRTELQVNSAGTGNASGFSTAGNFGTASSAFTLGTLFAFRSAVFTAGAGSTITRAAAYGGVAPTAGTNNAYITDNATWTGNYFINSTSTDASLFSGNIQIGTAGKGLLVKEGSNAKMGTCTLSSGACTVSTTAVATTSRVFLTTQSLGTVSVPKAIAVTSRSNGVSFVVTSADATDTSVVAWLIVDPAP